jgi:adenosylmethionine-8-amino-7-oxononanoate aminotransferase
MGAIAVIEMKQPVNLPEIQKKFVEQGLWVRPFGKLVYLMPPFIMTDTQIEQLTRGVFGVLSEL